MGQPVEQRVTAPTPEDLDRLRAQRAVIEQFIDESSLERYATSAGKLGAIRALLDAEVFRPDQTYELQCLGIVLGDALAQELGMEWVTVEDAHGRDPAVQIPNTTIILFPLTMISKRVERGEKVDVFDLFNGLSAQVARLRSKSGDTPMN